MATFAEFMNEKKKKKKNESGQSFAEYSKSMLGNAASNGDASVSAPTTSGGVQGPAIPENLVVESAEDKKWYEEFFKKSEGNFWQTLGGTAYDFSSDVVKGVGGMVEGIADLVTYGVAGVADLVGAEETAENWKEAGRFDAMDALLGDTDRRLEKYSVLGDTSDMVSQGLGQVAAMILTAGVGAAGGLSQAATSALTTGVMGASSFGGGMTEAYQSGATDGEAVAYGAMKGVVDAGSELIFGGFGKGVKALGLSKGLSSLDDVAAKKLSSKISNRFFSNLTEFGVKASAEGVEEVLAGIGTAAAKKLSYMSDEDFQQLLKDENLMEQFVVGAITSGISQSGIVPGMKSGSLIDATKKGQDFITGMNANETSVINKVYADEIAQKEADGKKLSKREKSKLYDQVVKALERGEIDTDAIESVLGGDDYKAYKNAVDKVDSLKKEIEKLENTPVDKFTVKQRNRLNKISEELKRIERAKTVDSLKTQMSQKVSAMAQNDRLGESYRENARRKIRYEADLSQYSEKQQMIVKKAIDSGILNNTRKSHELVDMIANLYEDKGVDFDFLNNEKLKASGYAVNGKHVNGYYDSKLGTIGINIDSKKYLNTVVGHEIAHVLEGTEAYEALKKALFAYAERKGEYASRRKALEDLYEAEDIDHELAADLVGDYIFSDPDFVMNLYAQDRNLFQKIWDEIKYLCKIATAGSKEARELERIKKTFEEAYREGGKVKVKEGNVDHSLSSIASTFFGDENMTSVAFEEADYKQTQGYKNYVEECVNNLRQSSKDFDEESARKEVEGSIDGIVRVALAAKRAGYDIYDDPQQRGKTDSKKRLLFSSLEPNSDYFTSSDISTICDKRKNFAEIYDDIVRAEEAKGIPEDKRFFKNVDNYFYLHKVLADKGLTQPCRECYVESMRKNLAPMGNAFLRLVRETDAGNKSNDQLYDKKGNLKSNNAATREWVIDKLSEYGESANSLTLEMLTTAEGLAQLKIQMPMIYEAFNSFYGQSKPKMPKSATPFRFGELTALLTDNNGNINQRLVNKINHTGGFRLQSYSDFQIQNYTDVLQTIFEAGTLGLKGHAYTKVPAFLDATAGTNLKRNISIFMYRDGAEWKLDRNDSFPYPLDEIYDIVDSDETGDTGIIAVSQNKEMSAWIMANDHIGYGIPFHKSGLKMATVRDTIVKEGGREIRGYSGTIDHTKQQTEVWAKTTEDHKAFTKVKKGIDIYSFWDFNNENGLSKNDLIKKNVEAYIDACEEAGYIPKFRDYVMNNEKVLNDVLMYSREMGMVDPDSTIDDISFKYKGYTIPYGYYKFLGDFGMFTPDGEASPQKTLSLKDYDFEKAVKFFEDSEELHRNEILQQFANGEERQKYRDSGMTAEQLEKVIKQKRNEIAQDVVNGNVKKSLSSEDAFPVRTDGYGIASEDVRFEGNAFDGFQTEADKAAAKEDVAKEETTAGEAAEEEGTVSEMEQVENKTEKSSKTESKKDRLEQYKKAEAERLATEKKILLDEFNQRKAALQKDAEGKSVFVSRRAKELYTELSALRKGVRASSELGYLLDHEFDWNTLKSTLLKVSRWPDEVINADSAEETAVRKMLDEEYNGKTNELSKLEAEYNAKVADLEKESAAKIKAYKTSRQARIKSKEYTDVAEKMIGDTSTWVDKPIGIAYKVNTLRRNLRDIVRDENGNRDIPKADAITDEYQGKYSTNEAEKNREATRIKKPYADMRITKEEDAYIQMLGEFRHNPDTTLKAEDVGKYYEKHKNKIDTAKVDKAIEEVRKTYDDLFERVNERLREQGMKEIPYRKGYFPHFTEDKQGFLAKLFNWKVKNNEIPTSIAGLTEQFKPNRSWQSFNKQRKTDITDYSFTKGLDTYVEGALDWIYHIEDIQKLRALENYIRYSRSDKGVQEKIDAIKKNETYDAEEMQEQIDLVYKEANNPLNNFVTDLRAYTNRLANKKSSMDRGVEEALNRKIYSVMTNVSSRVSANAVAANFASALSNFIPLTQLTGTVPIKSTARATADVLRSYRVDDGVVDKSTFLTNRLRKADNLYKSGWDKFGDKLGIMFEGIDNLTSQIVWRSKYLDNLSHGMSEAESIKNADQFAAGLMADRSKGNLPTIFESKNPLIKLFTAFQLEVNNQYGYMFKDMPADIGQKSKKNLVKAYFGMFGAAFVYNELTSMLTGRYAAFDPIRIIKDLIEDLADDDEEEPFENILDAAAGFGKDVAEEIPFIGGVLGGGRLPISSALPDWKGLWDALHEEDIKTGLKQGVKAFDGTFYYGVLPMAGGQIKKTVEGLSMFDEDNTIAGSYTDSGKLRFPVEDTVGSRIKAGLFGQWSSKNAMEYFDEGRSPLSEKQTQELADLDISIQEYWEYQDDLRKLSTVAEKKEYINGLDLEDWQKKIMLENVSSGKGSSSGTNTKPNSGYSNLEEFDYAKNNPEEYALSKAISRDFAEYKQYLEDLEAITDEDEEARREKVIEYINELDAEYGEKIVLYKSLYKNDNTYNKDIVDFLNKRYNLSYEDIESVLKSLDFDVDEEGNISWKE